MAKQNETCKRLLDIPGVGPLIATAAVATMGEASAFKSGREFAAYVGLVPRQTGSGGKIRLPGISKRGDTYLRTLFIHGWSVDNRTEKTSSGLRGNRRHGKQAGTNSVGNSRPWT